MDDAVQSMVTLVSGMEAVLVPDHYRTDGERLADYLRLRVISGIDELAGLRQASQTLQRQHLLAFACEQLLVFNLLERLMGLARWAARQSADSAVREQEIRSRLYHEVSIQYDDVPRLWNHLGPAIRQSTRTVSPVLKAEVLDYFGTACYVCGLECGNDATVDHLWPRSMGGNSDFENLLPCCSECNERRGNSMNWAHAWFQGVSASPEPGVDEQRQFGYPKNRVAAIFLRAFVSSLEHGESLQKSLLAVGPNVDRDFSDVDEPIDFFKYATRLAADE